MLTNKLRNKAKIATKLLIYPSSPKRIFMICFQRSGSNMLTSVLNKHPNINVIGQIFKDEDKFQQQLRQMKIPSFTGKLFNDNLNERNEFYRLENNRELRDNRNTFDYIDSIYKAYNRKTVANNQIIKLHGGTLFKDELKILMCDKRNKFILLTRRNLIQNAISWYVARLQNEWMISNDKKYTKNSIHIDVEILRQYIFNLKYDEALWCNLISTYNPISLKLKYEDIIDVDFDWNKIWRFLDLSPIDNTKPSTSKIHNSYDHITNLDQVKQSLESEENGYISNNN